MAAFFAAFSSLACCALSLFAAVFDDAFVFRFCGAFVYATSTNFVISLRSRFEERLCCAGWFFAPFDNIKDVSYRPYLCIPAAMRTSMPIDGAYFAMMCARSAS